MLSEEGPGVCSQLLDCQGFLASNSFNSLPLRPPQQPSRHTHTSPHTCDIQNRCDLPLRLPVWGEGFCIAVAVATEAVMVVMMEAEVAMVLVVGTNTLCRSSRCGSVG